MSKKNRNGIPTYLGVPIFGNIVNDLVDECVKDTHVQYYMELQDKIKISLIKAYNLGKRTTNAYYKNKYIILKN